MFKICDFERMPPDPPSRARASPSDALYAVDRPPPSKILDPPLVRVCVCGCWGVRGHVGMYICWCVGIWWLCMYAGTAGQIIYWGPTLREVVEHDS